MTNIYVNVGKKGMQAEFWCGNILKDFNLEDKKKKECKDNIKRDLMEVFYDDEWLMEVAQKCVQC